MARVIVRITPNFERNIEEIRKFLADQDTLPVFDALLELLFDVIIPNLEQFPEMGRDFLAHPPQSVETEVLHRQLQKLLGSGASLREYICGDYLLLYTLRNKAIHLLALKHHRQLSFDLRTHWSGV